MGNFCQQVLKPLGSYTWVFTVMHFKGFLACLISLFHFIIKVLFFIIIVKGKPSKLCKT